MGQRIKDAGQCPYCNDTKKEVYYWGLYPEDEALMEVHCNTCRSSWNGDGSPRAYPSEAKLKQLGVYEASLKKGLNIGESINGEWADGMKDGNELQK